MENFRPGIQLGMVVLVLAVEIVVIRLMTQMSWATAAIAAASANLVSGFFGRALGSDVRLTEPAQLFPLIIPSTIIEALVVVPFARRRSRRPGQRGYWAFIGVLVANILSASVCVGYLWLNYRSEPQPVLGREGWAMLGSAGALRRAARDHEGSVPDAIAESRAAASLFLLATRQNGPRLLDVAPLWLPWSQRRWLAFYETGEIPEKLAAEGQGKPMIWTGAVYLNGRRVVVFSDGSSKLVTESEFHNLNAVPRPVPQWLTELLKENSTQSSESRTLPPSPHVPRIGFARTGA